MKTNENLIEGKKEMAKERRNNSITDAISAITTAIRAEVNAELHPSEKAKIVNDAMHVVDNSGIVTLAEHTDDAIELKHQIEEAAAEEAEAAAHIAEQAAAEETAEPAGYVPTGGDDTGDAAKAGGDGKPAENADDAPRCNGLG